ncbi:MAG: 3-oxoacyl-[acyl-carrier-protein] synthase-3 [Lentimonas sp.]|jgi:3-oxoacyl-[acyl-carrier-protein] synthase-3
MKNQGKSIKIVSMGTYVPKVITSTEIENRYGIPLGWAEKYSGVYKRHHVQKETIGFMGARAAEEALKNANMDLDEIDMLISAGGTHDYVIPNQASVIKEKMKNGKKFDFSAIDIDSTCLSFVAAMDFASRMLDGIQIRNILIVSSEISSKGMDTTNWETMTLFGDGAAAAILTFDENADSKYYKGMQKTYSEGTYHAMIEGGGNVNYFKDHPYDEKMYGFKMEGKKLLRLGKIKLPEFVDNFFNDLELSITDIDCIIPHSASKMALHVFQDTYSFNENQMQDTLSTHGNCIAASIPLTLAKCIGNGRIKRGDTVYLLGTSAGFSIGGFLFKY